MTDQSWEWPVTDVTYAVIDEMETNESGIARKARASLGVTAWGMSVMELPPDFDGYPEHRHDASAEDAHHEEVYIPLRGSGTLIAGEETFALRPGVMARVGPEQLRRIVAGPEGIRFVALGGVVGAHRPTSWTALSG